MTMAKMKRLSLHLRTVLLLVWTLACGGDGYSCPYGQACGFEPAAPGRTPNCALPGLTYCVHPDPYPERLIRQLLEIGSYDVRTLLSDESRDDFGARRDPYGYGPNSIPNIDQISLVNDVYPKNYNKFNNRFNNDIFTQKTPLQPPSLIDPTPYNINSYQATNFSNFGFQGYQTNTWNPNQFHNNNYNKKVYRPNNVLPNLGGYDNSFFPTINQNLQNYDSTNDWLRQASNGVTQYNPNEWWKYLSPSHVGADVAIQGSISFPPRSTAPRIPARRRRNAELVRASAQRQLTGAEALRIALGLSSDETSAERSRRQADGVEQLCSVRTEYITPRAALNNKGSWRYVVNMPTNTTQLVKVELCAATECGGLCSVPPGYTTRCEQKYIQKRLVALQANGQNLYTDVFWIPSCCQCTVLRN